MSKVITVENLGKKYTLSHQQREQYTALRDVITNGIRNFSKTIFSPFTTHSSPISTSEDFWALKDVTFEVKQGDRIGIIGRNGAGKSTLLKILSRITEPTTGSIRIKGRVASLLEVGTGFHPELTGRENIFLNGAILGMSRVEIKKKFDEIVDFAEIEKFLDTPVKRYSSGMYVRLAFAVAAHLEPEILIVDEVLAVGDAAFQKKCLGKMKDVGREGRTILFVSHNMAAIKALCTKCALLENGFLKATGETHSIVSEYFNATMDFNTNKDLSDRVDRVGGKKISCIHFDILNLDKDSMKDVCCGMPISIEFIFESKVAHLENLRFGLYFCYKETGELLTELNTYYNSKKIYSCQKGSYKIKFSWPKLPLSPGTYIINIIITSGLEVLDWVRDAGQLNVVEGSYYDSGLMPLPGNYPVFFSDFDFSLIQNND